MQHTLLGSTDILLSRLGLGTVKFGRNTSVKYPDAFDLPSDKEARKLLDYAAELGINFLDTAPAYGISEERLGKLLSNNRQKWVISTKVGEEFENNVSTFNFTKEHTRLSIERSLKRLRTDYLDMVLVHSNGDDKNLLENTELVPTLRSIKKAGLIRAFGFSSKTIEGGKLAVDKTDVVMVTYNLLETVEREVIAYAHQHNKGVLIKKGLASGHLEKFNTKNPIQTAMEFIFEPKGVTAVVVGSINPQHLQDNVRAVNNIS